MEEFAEVIKTQGDTAIVQITRHAACSKCDHKCGLAQSSHETDSLEVEVENTIGAKEGELVSLEMDTQPIVMASLIVYLIPLIGLISGYFIGLFVGRSLGFDSTETAGILGSIIIFLLSFVLIRIIDYVLGVNKDYHPQITKIIK